MECRYCRIELDPDEDRECADRKECTKRTRARARRSISGMKQVPLKKDRQKALYEQVMREQRSG